MEKEKLFLDICMDLWAQDCSISYDLFIETVKSYINNLKSSVGPAAHKYLQEAGVEDMTGLSWEEQDNKTRQQIKELEGLLDYLKDDKNWTP